MKKFKDYIETESFTEEEWGDILFAKELDIRKISEDVSRSDLDQIEKYADKLFSAVGIDVEFTRHFLDRVNDERNKKPINTAELIRLFRLTYKKHGKKIPKMGPDAQAVIHDMETDVNMPFVLQRDRDGMLDMVAKTVMRKKDFKTSNQKLKVYMSDDFDFGFSAVSTEEFQKTQVTTEEQPSSVSSEEFDELKKKMDSISSLIQALGDKDDTSLFDETGDKISRLEEKVDKILEIESTQIASALGEQSNSIRAVIDEVEERKGELNEKFASRLKELETLVIPMLKGLMKNPDKEYIYWPNRTPILEKQIEKVYSITRET